MLRITSSVVVASNKDFIIIPGLSFRLVCQLNDYNFTDRSNKMSI